MREFFLGIPNSHSLLISLDSPTRAWFTLLDFCYTFSDKQNVNSSKNVNCFITRFVINHFPNWRRREMQTFSSGSPRKCLGLWRFLLVEYAENHCAELDRMLINIFFLSHSDLFCLLVGVDGYCNIWSHPDTPHSVEILWTSDQPNAETSTWQHTAIKRERHPCPRQDSIPQSQQAIGRRTTH